MRPLSDPAPDRYTTLPASAASRRESRYLPGPLQSVAPPHYPEMHSAPQWHFPVYTDNPHPGNDVESIEEFPIRRVSRLPIVPDDDRRDSDATLFNGTQREDDRYKKYSLSSYNHPYDITPPPGTHPPPHAPPQISAPPRRSALRRSVSFAENDHVREYDPNNGGANVDEEESFNFAHERELKKRGILSNYLDLYALDHDDPRGGDDVEKQKEKGTMNSTPSQTGLEHANGSAVPRQKLRRFESTTSMGSTATDLFDPDDPKVTGVKKQYLDDLEDIEKNVLRQMDYKSRRKARQRIRIEFNICCE